MVLQTKSAVIILTLCCLITTSCNPKNKNMPLVSVDVQAIPVVHSEDVVTFISDSNSTIRMESKIWEIYSNDSEPYHYLPEGIFVERLDSLLRVDLTIVADTAYYYEKKELWHAIGNVVVTNILGDVFETSELFWDAKVPQDKMDAFYTHQPVKILKPDSTVIYGLNGFTADPSLRVTRLYAGKADLYIDESNDTAQNTVIQDSIQLQ